MLGDIVVQELGCYYQEYSAHHYLAVWCVTKKKLIGDVMFQCVEILFIVTVILLELVNCIHC